MAKTHVFILVSPEGTCSLTRSNGPICFQQSRQEVGGHFEAYDPHIGPGHSAQVHESFGRQHRKPNTVFEGVAGNVLIGRTHGSESCGLNPDQQKGSALPYRPRQAKARRRNLKPAEFRLCHLRISHTSAIWHPRPFPPIPGGLLQLSVNSPLKVNSRGMSNSTGAVRSSILCPG